MKSSLSAQSKLLLTALALPTHASTSPLIIYPVVLPLGSWENLAETFKV